MTEFTYGDSLNGTQKQWFQEAMSRMDDRFPISTVPMKVTVHAVAEPPCPGHNDYMCTTTTRSGGVVVKLDINIRDGAETQAVAKVPTVDMVHTFYMESAVHEIGHCLGQVFFATDDSEKDKICGWFIYRGENGGTRRGELSDWDPDDKPWDAHIAEAWAEWIKDLYLPRQFRAYDNRTDWWFDEQHLDDFFDMVEEVICPQPVIIS